MNISQAKEKISKLLALAQSDNANEANAAMLAARRLMAQYKLSEHEVNRNNTNELRKVCYEDNTYSGIRNKYYCKLADVIARHHCCDTARRGIQNSTVGKVVFVGLGHDPDIACEIFAYAIDHISRVESRKLQDVFDEERNRIRTKAIVKEYIYNYAMGFAEGLRMQYIQQDNSECKETALALVVPVEVTDYMKSLRPGRYCRGKDIAYNASAREEGYSDGFAFKPTKQIRAPHQG